MPFDAYPNSLEQGSVSVVDLTPNELRKRYPSLQQAFGDGQVVSHSYAVEGHFRIATFVLRRD